MRFIAAVFLIFLFLTPPTSAIDRFELEGEISLIVTSLRPDYYILTLVNKNDFNITHVENLQVNFTHSINPALVSAVDNYNTTVVPEKIERSSITFTYDNTLPSLGYGKIFLSLDKPGPTLAPPTTTATTTTISTTTTVTIGTITTSTTKDTSTTTSTTSTTTTEPPLNVTLPPTNIPPPDAIEDKDKGPSLTTLIFIILLFLISLFTALLLRPHIKKEEK
jgi:hypothetical protein